MTTENTNNRWDYTGDGATAGPFTFDNKIFVDADLQVFVDGSQLSSGYTVTGAGDDDGGSITFDSAPADQAAIVLIRAVSGVQESDYVDGSDFPADTIEDDFDRAVILAQQLADADTRTLRLENFDTPSPLGRLPVLADRASTRLGFDADGDPISVTSDITGVAATAFGTSIAEAAGAAAARILLGLVIGTDVEAFDADILRADTAATLTKGFDATEHDLGTLTTGTTTLDPADGNFQTAVNGGAHTLAAPGETCSIVVQYTNNASAGTITISGFTEQTGESLTTTDGDDFLLYVTVVNGFSTLHVRALQ